ncbi:MAG TPA: GNAT family N-acetyltransferase [Vicinamibacteria bacterium]|nr:GNAT family N-acetyltransferase [Vicinamibacteria bacterium]
MPPVFRPATSGDLNAVLPLLRDFYAEDGEAYDAEAGTALLALLADPSLGRVVLIVDDEGVAVGYVVVAFGYSLEFRGRDAFVDELYVAPTHRGRGLGRAALREAERCCLEAGIRALHLEVRPGKTEARGLYASAGYADREYYLMSKKLR